MPSAEAIRLAKQWSAEMGYSVTPPDNWQSPNGPEDYGRASNGHAAEEPPLHTKIPESADGVEITRRSMASKSRSRRKTRKSKPSTS
jgi:hypothetical protein